MNLILALLMLINGGCYTPPCTNGYSCPLTIGHHLP